MKTMTCAQLGGPCDHQFTGDSADQIIKQQDQHLKEAVAKGDESHVPARNDMKGRWRHPKRSLGWYNEVKATFASLPES
jgi:predicted small metal-binding protein